MTQESRTRKPCAATLSGVRISAKPLLSLKNWFIAVFFFGWNATCLGALALNGWSGKMQPGPAQWLTVTQLVVSSALALGIVVIPKLHEALIDPERSELYEPQPFVFIGILAAGLAVACAIGR